MTVVSGNMPAAVQEMGLITPGRRKDGGGWNRQVYRTPPPIEELPVIRVRAKVRPFTVDDLRQVWLTEKLIGQNLAGRNAMRRIGRRNFKVSVVSAADDDHSSPGLGHAVIGRIDNVGARNSVTLSQRRKRGMEVIAETREAGYILHQKRTRLNS